MSFSVPSYRLCGLHRWLAWAFVLGFVVAPACAAAAEVSFEDALRLAAERAPMLEARRLRIDAAREETARASALPDPRLTLGVNNWPVTGDDAFDFGADFMTMKQIGVMQEFPSRAKRRARRVVAERTTEQARALSAAERLAVRRASAEAWIGLWAAQLQSDALKALREPAAVAVEAAKAGLAGGTGTAVDAMTLQTAALELENRIDAAEADVDVARAVLSRWLGEDGGIRGEPPDMLTLPIDEAVLLASIDRQVPLLPWRSREAVAEAEVILATAEKRPDWNLGLTYGQRNDAPDGRPRSDMLMLQLAIDLPLFTRNRQDRGIAARRAEWHAVAAAHDDARRAQAEAVRSTLAEWKGLRRQVQRLHDQTLPLAHDRSRTALANYRAGGALQPWIEASRDEIEIRIKHAHHLGELGRAWAALAYLLPEEESQS
jgi:outer membrane protein TolC